MGEDTLLFAQSSLATSGPVILFLAAFALTVVALDSHWWRDWRTRRAIRRHQMDTPPDPRYTLTLVHPEPTESAATREHRPPHPGA